MSVAEFLNPDGWFSQDNGPRYVQLRRRIEDGIAAGVLKPESPLPPEREIASLTEMSRVTVRKAIEALVEAGTIVQKQGSGSFIAPETRRVEQSLSRLTSFSEDMQRRGMKTEAVFLERGVFMPSPEEVVALALAPDASVSRIKRLRTADRQPMAIERASLPVDLLPDPVAVDKSLYDYLGDRGTRPVRAIQKISAINLGPEEATHLNLPEGAAGLSIQRISYLASGRVVEFTTSIYRGDAYDFVAELRLTDT